MHEKNLYRAKSIDTGKWIEGYLYIDVQTSRPVIQEHETLTATSICENSVGQFTGLRDKKRTSAFPKGQKIFEGDIISGLFRFGLAFNAVVVFQDGAFGLEWIHHSKRTFSSFTGFCNVEFEVIGNIVDTPELISEARSKNNE